jgi:hypothetical protein
MACLITTLLPWFIMLWLGLYNNYIHNTFLIIMLLSSFQASKFCSRGHVRSAHHLHATSQIWLFNLLVLLRSLLDCGYLLFKFSFATICSSSSTMTWSSDLSLYFLSNLQLDEFLKKNTLFSVVVCTCFVSVAFGTSFPQLWFGTGLVSVAFWYSFYLSCSFMTLSELWFAIRFVSVIACHWFCLCCDLEPALLSQLRLSPTLVLVAIWSRLQL